MTVIAPEGTPPGPWLRLFEGLPRTGGLQREPQKHEHGLTQVGDDDAVRGEGVHRPWWASCNRRALDQAELLQSAELKGEDLGADGFQGRLEFLEANRLL